MTLLTDLVPYAALCAALYALCYEENLPHIVIWALVGFIGIQARVLYRIFRNAWASSSRGALTIPKIRSWAPMNVDMIYKGIRLQSRIIPGSLSHPYFAKLNSNTINMRLLGKDNLLTKDPLVIKHILTGASFSNYGKGPDYKKAFNDFLGVGIFNSDPDEIWKFHRALTKPFFNKERVTGLSLNHIDKMVNGLKTRSLTDPIDLQNVFRRLTFDASADFLFGYRNNALDQYFAGESNQDGFAPAFDRMGFSSLRAYLLGSLTPAYELIFGSLTKAPLQILNPLIDNIVNEALERKSHNHPISENPADKHAEKHAALEHANVLDYLVTQTSDRKLIRDELLNLMLAGRDTTAALLTSLFAQFALNPEIYTRAREECIRLFGEDGEPDYQVMRDSRYLRAILNETLRMFPPVPTNVRYAFQDDVVNTSDGRQFFVPGGTLFNYSLWWMQRDPNLWGDDADVWDPDRWLDNRIEKMTSNPFIFQPFSAGPRLCLGQQHAYNQATLVMIRMCQTFEKVELAPDAQPGFTLLPTFQVTLNWRGGVWVRLSTLSASS